MEGKKISFSFKKIKKVEKPVIEEKKDYIECLEEKSIKVVGGEETHEEQPLVIPLKPNTLITAERLKEIAEKVEGSLEEPMEVKKEVDEIKTEPTENLTLDELAVKELLQDAKKEIKVEKQELTVPVPATPVIEGQKESTLEDYESVPVQDFGLAMLRGMGWTPNKELLAKHKQPELRPKGLGLGADKVISDKQKKKGGHKNDKEEELAIVKNSYVKIIAGKHSGYYGKVVSLDEDNGRVMVDLTVKNETVSLSEFMMQPVTKAEFDKESKVINTDAYQEYKKNERSQEKPSKNESPKVSERQRRDSPKVSDKETSSSKRSKEIKEESRKRDDRYNGTIERKQEKSRRDYSNDDDVRRRKENKRDSSSSEDRNSRRKERSRRNSSSSEDRSSRRRKEKSKRESSGSEDRSRRKQKERSSRDNSGSVDRTSRRKERSKRDSSSEDRSTRRRKEKSKRDMSEERSRKKEKDKKKYGSNESLDSISDSEKKSKSKHNRKVKDSSDSESDSQSHKKDKRDIDKKRKGKKKKRDRDRSPNYKKHRK